jgi:hypothetical protein
MNPFILYLQEKGYVYIDKNKKVRKILTFYVLKVLHVRNYLIKSVKTESVIVAMLVSTT